MSQNKEVLHGVLTLALTVKTDQGILAKGQLVQMSADLEVTKAVVGNTVGYCMVPNKVAGGKATFVMFGFAALPAVSGAAYAVGSLLTVNSSGKLVEIPDQAGSGASVRPIAIALEAALGADETHDVLYFA